MNVLLIILLALKGGDPSLPPATVDAGITVSAAQEIPEPRFRILKPMMPLRGQTKSLVDINSHLAPNPEGTNYESDDDLGHERTHGINSNLRHNLQHCNAFYVLQDRCIILRDPRITKAHVRQFVPRNYATSGQYKTYLADQPETGGMYQGMVIETWNKIPSHIIDEFVAYTNGSQVHLEYAQSGVNLNRSGSIEHMMEFCIYATAFIQAMDRYDPNHPDREQYILFVYWNIKRAIGIYQQSLNYPILRDAEADFYYNDFIRRYVK